MPAKWNFGFEAQSKDKVFRAKFGGQLQFDYTDFNQASQLTTTPINAPPGDPAGGIGRQNESVNFRRLRLRSEGTMYENVGWVVQPDFANAVNVSNVPGNPPGFPNSLNQAGFPAGQTLAIAPSLTDCYVTVMKLPVVNNTALRQFQGADRPGTHDQQPVSRLHGTKLHSGHDSRPVQQRVFAGR